MGTGREWLGGGRVKLVIPPATGLHPEHPSSLREKELSIKNNIEADPLAWAASKSQTIQNKLDGSDGQPPIIDRPVTTPGNISMYQYLTTLKNNLDLSPEATATTTIEKHNARITLIEKKLQIPVVW